ncbi:hypothetical protein DMN91_009035 [Ooceraea biroi]|uniref:H/ACA ribonucleoprotein complex non-core subunit NAF1 n=1 Tax=Ooceraea biroi TaxID=2015173 RepID=A0A3L8DFK5_OOCBI|nr:hypothetical protein DMN91_009035 [Ooceraea biroi]
MRRIKCDFFGGNVMRKCKYDRVQNDSRRCTSLRGWRIPKGTYAKVEETTGLKSLGVIALEYGDSSDVEDMEDTNENLNQPAVPSVQALNLQQQKKSNVANKQIQKSELDDLPPIEDLMINVDELLCDVFGKVFKIVEQVVIVQPIPGKPTLNLDSVLFLDKGQKTLGTILDVYGHISEPLYCVRFNSSEHIQKCNIEVDMTVYYCPNVTSYTTIFFAQELRQLKHSDTIDENEAPVFSDDEEERKYQMQKDKNVSHDNTPQKKNAPNPCKKRRYDWQSNHPWNRCGYSQWYNQEAQPCINAMQNEQYSFPQANPRQYSFQNNMYRDQAWSSIPHCPPSPCNRPYGVGAAYNGPRSYNSNNAADANQDCQDVKPNFQRNNTMYQYPKIPFGMPARINPTSPPYPMNYHQLFNAQIPYMGMPPYPMYAYPPMSTHTNPACPFQSTHIPVSSPSSTTTSATTVNKSP